MCPFSYPGLPPQHGGLPPPPSASSYYGSVHDHSGHSPNKYGSIHENGGGHENFSDFVSLVPIH